MNSRFLLPGLALLALTSNAFAETGPVTMVSLTNAPASTPATPQTNAPSAPAPGSVAPSASSGGNDPAKATTKALTTPPASTPADPVAATPHPAPAPAAAPAGTTPAAPASPAANKASVPLLDKFISDLSDAMKLSDDEKKGIQSYYVADAPALQKILNDATLSPLQQAEQVADLRDKRDAKIDALLEDPIRQHEFYKVEANYRVAMTEDAADGALVPPPASPAATPPPAATK
jgi:hypothetical protein